MKFITYNLGCKVNAYELRAITSLMLKEGYILGDINHFDIAIINTCTVTQVASQKSRQHIHKFRLLNKDAVIIAMGCDVNNEAKNILNDCGADIVLGVNNRHLIIGCLKEFLKTKEKINKSEDMPSLRKKCQYEELGLTLVNENARAYVKIEDGCDNFCSYCLIPLMRGKARSRAKEAIFKEIEALIHANYKEIILTGIDTASYGKEFPNYHFSDLLKDILEKFPNLYRLRISSIEISQIDDNFLLLLKKHKNIANHLHIPLQSGSDSVLKRMNRKYTCKQYFEAIKKIRKARLDIAITSDVIVGFPNESEDEFNETYEFIKRIKFMELHVFPFSKRKGTGAYLMKDVDNSVKKKRVHKLIALSKQLKKEYQSQFINQELEVLFENNSEGLTSNYIRVKEKGKPNEIKKIRLNSLNIV